MNIKNFYKDYHNYFIRNRNNFSEDMKILNGESQYFSKYSQKDYSFYYLRNYQQLAYTIKIIKCRDILNGIYFGNYPIGSEFTIYKKSYPLDVLLKIKLTEKNKDDIFLPINNRDFLNIFLLSSQEFYITSNRILMEPMYLIYSNIKRNFHNYFFNPKYFIQKIEKSHYFVYTEHFVSINDFENTKFQDEYSMYFFYFDIDKLYGRKILRFYRKYRFKQIAKKVLEDDYHICKDITKIILTFL